MVLGQRHSLTLDSLYHPERKIELTPVLPFIVRWMQDGEHYVQKKTQRDSKLPQLVRVNARTGKVSPLYDSSLVSLKLSRLKGFNEEKAERLRRKGQAHFSPDESAILWNFEGDLFYQNFKTGLTLRVTRTKEPEKEYSFSPDGRNISYIRGFDLFVYDLYREEETRLTRNGSKNLRNGLLDWIYQEEVYGRGSYKGYWWSPDSNQIVYLQLDESPVPNFTVIDNVSHSLFKEVTPYPKAGDPNPIPRLGVVSKTGGKPHWIDLHCYSPSDLLIVGVGWNQDGSRVVFQAQNKEQTWLDLNLVDPKNGVVKRIFRETTKAWVNILGDPYWLEDGSFLWKSERSGWCHLYHYRSTGELIRTLTSGEWEVRRLHGVDKNRFWVYFSGTKRSHIGQDLYRVQLLGGSPERISTREGTHNATFNHQFSLYYDHWSDIRTPPQISLHDSHGNEIRALLNRSDPKLSDYRLIEPEFYQVKTRDGFSMEAMLIKPPNFNSAKKYPVLLDVYGGPHVQKVRNAWGGKAYLWNQLMAQKGYVIWACDNRTASGKGAESVWPLYRNFGELELLDIEDGLFWLKSHAWIDDKRIGLWGWSFGGYMTSYALTHSKSFKLGVAGAPVTDWKLYDTIYTERYMGTPESNPEGYKSSSVLEAVDDLHGRLMIIHGDIDNNVHLQNTIQLIYKLQKTGKQFDLMIYPKSRHQIRDSEQLYHMKRMIMNFILENL